LKIEKQNNSILSLLTKKVEEIESENKEEYESEFEELKLTNKGYESKIEQLELKIKQLVLKGEILSLIPNPYNDNMYIVKEDGLSVKFEFIYLLKFFFIFI
jgi:hypothetical protein